MCKGTNHFVGIKLTRVATFRWTVSAFHESSYAYYYCVTMCRTDSMTLTQMRLEGSIIVCSTTSIPQSYFSWTRNHFPNDCKMFVMPLNVSHRIKSIANISFSFSAPPSLISHPRSLSLSLSPAHICCVNTFLFVLHNRMYSIQFYVQCSNEGAYQQTADEIRMAQAA